METVLVRIKGSLGGGRDGGHGRGRCPQHREYLRSSQYNWSSSPSTKYYRYSIYSISFIWINSTKPSSRVVFSNNRRLRTIRWTRLAGAHQLTSAPSQPGDPLHLAGVYDSNSKEEKEEKEKMSWLLTDETNEAVDRDWIFAVGVAEEFPRRVSSLLVLEEYDIW